MITTGELDLCGVDIVVPDETGGSGGAELLVSDDDIVVCGEHPPLVRVGDCLSVVGGALLCDAAVAWSTEGASGHRSWLGQEWLHLVGLSRWVVGA